MAGYTSAPTIGGYGNINASNYGQYDAQGYDTSPYAYSTAPSMSLGQAAWIDSTSKGYKSPYAGVSNLDYMQAVKQRASMFWDQAAAKGVGAAAYGTSYLALNAGSAFMSMGLTIGGGTQVNEAAGLVNWAKTGATRNIGERLYNFGHAGEHGFIAQKLWHGGATPFFKSMANTAAGAGEWVGRGVGEGLTALAEKAGWEGGARHVGSAGDAVGGWLSAAAKKAKSGQGWFKGSAGMLESASGYFRKHGVIAGVTKAGLRGTAALAAPMAYFVGTSALLNAGISGVENVFTAGDDATQSAALTFESLKGKIFNKGGRDAAVRNAEDIAQAIKKQVVGEQGISGLTSRFLFGHKLNGEIEKKTALFGAFADYGLVDKSSSGGEFVKKARELEEAVKSLSKTFQATTSKTLDMVRVMKSQGIGNGQLASAGTNTQLTADMSGYSREQVMSIQSRGSEAFRGTYFSPEVGIGIANDVIRRTSVMENTDPEYSKTAFAMRGKDSMNVFLTKMQSNLANSSNVKKMLIASMYENRGGSYVYTGKVNKAALQKEMAGQKTYLSDFNTQAELVQKYNNELTTSQKFKTDVAIQDFSEHLGAGQMNKLVGSALKTAAHMTKEEGLAIQYVNQGLSPKVAASLAKAMSKDISNDVVSATYKADALRSLNTKAAGNSVSNSLLSGIGDNLDLGIVSSLLSFTGGISDKVFGKTGAGVGELGLGIGGMMAVGGAVLPGMMVAGAMASAAYGYDKNSYAAGGSMLATQLAGMGMYSTAGALGFGGMAAGGMAAGATATGLLGGMAGAGAATAVGRAYYGMTNRELLRDRTNMYAGMNIGGGAIGGGALTAGLTGYLLGAAALTNPLGLAAIGTATIAGAAAGTYKYITERDEDDLLQQREDVQGTAKSVRDMSLLGNSDFKNQLLNSYVSTSKEKYSDLPSVKKFSKGHDTIFNREMSRLNAGELSVDDFLSGQAGWGMLSNSSKDIADLHSNQAGVGRRIIADAGYGFVDETDTAVYKQEVTNVLRKMYRQGNQNTKDEMLKGKPKAFREMLEGGFSAPILSLSQQKNTLDGINKGKKHKVTLGQSTALAGALNEMAGLMDTDPDLYSSMRGDANNTSMQALAKKYGLSSDYLYSYVNENYKKDTTSSTFREAASTLGQIGVSNMIGVTKTSALKAVGSAFSVKQAATVGNALGSMIASGRMTEENTAALSKALGKTGGGQFGADLRGMIATSANLYDMSQGDSFDGKGMSKAEADAMMQKEGYKGALNMDMFKAAAGNDDMLTSKELADFSKQTLMLGGVKKSANDELAVSPSEAVGEIKDNVKRTADYLEVLVRNAGDTSQGDGLTTFTDAAGTLQVRKKAKGYSE